MDRRQRGRGRERGRAGEDFIPVDMGRHAHQDGQCDDRADGDCQGGSDQRLAKPVGRDALRELLSDRRRRA